MHLPCTYSIKQVFKATKQDCFFFFFCVFFMFFSPHVPSLEFHRFGSMPGSVCVRLHVKFPRVEGGDPLNGLHFPAANGGSNTTLHFDSKIFTFHRIYSTLFI